jgi:hypothetical protein
MMAKQTFVHIGTPKSGTNFLHGVLWRNAETLREAGFLLPGRMVAHYAAARAVTSRHDDPESDTAEPANATDSPWAKLARQAQRWNATAFIGHPQLAGASGEQAETALDALDPLGGDLHLVVTARALHLQPALSWQDQVKSGLATDFDTFLAALRDDRSRGRRFWRVHDIASLAERWRGDRIPAERIHVVPVRPLPRPKAAGPTELWDRYATTLGLDPAAYDSDLEVTTLPLGPAELELLRRLHARRDPRFTDPQRHVWTRQLLANEILARRPAPPLGLPDEMAAFLGERTRAILDAVATAGYDVAGDLTDLGPAPAPSDTRLAGDVTEVQVDEAATWTILRLQEELVHREPSAAPPPVGPDDGIDAILELLEHIRAADTGAEPRPAPERDESRVARIRRALPVRRHR